MLIREMPRRRSRLCDVGLQGTEREREKKSFDSKRPGIVLRGFIFLWFIFEHNFLRKKNEPWWPLPSRQGSLLELVMAVIYANNCTICCVAVGFA